jgi:hypothetical protein
VRNEPNWAGWKKPSCKTKPIGRRRRAQRVIRTRRTQLTPAGCTNEANRQGWIPHHSSIPIPSLPYKRSQFGAAVSSVKSQGASGRRQVPAGTGVTRAPMSDNMVNKRSQFSSSACSVLQGAWRTTPCGVTTNAGPVVQTKPIGGVRYPIIPLFYHSGIPIPSLSYKQSQSGGSYRAKQSQFAGMARFAVAGLPDWGRRTRGASHLHASEGVL